MSSPFVAEIRIVGFNFPPKGWAFCDGQLLPISQNTALFSLLGTFYGGEGKSNFALPNLQGAAPLGAGQSSASGSDYFIGEESGVDYVTLLTTEIPVHSHSLNISTQPAVARQPGGQLTAVATGVGLYGPNTGNTAAFAPQAMSIAGGSQPHNNMQPYLTLNFIIAMQGVFPPRG
jgi:microcystin-dependent protein